MLGRRVAKNMKKDRPAKSETRVARKAMPAGNGSDAKGGERIALSGKKLTNTLNRLFAQERWADARAVIEKELARDPSGKIEAIKVYREDTGVGLAEAKEAVERFIASLER